MLKTIKLKSLARDPVFIDKNGIVNEISSNNKVYRVKFKNMIILSLLAKFKSLIKSNFGAGFLTFKTRLTFTKLR